ncbi:Bax inhibitor-1 family protein [bacterium endosymbiont of Bathymodiolus sp. 5 South]|jgi:modulator of FtsH protease|uniref:Bax inhibitor-1 family protein n=1 Tax=bacterium endosymbiont of Bathymodiolus sp. 5 South TaxID=1181670 RepID=UPI0010B5A983|nr:Bax inhibitor-1 family protein [bacterium endosymbiont of Bathymodiolus sp. 5 South]CAC9653614.1 Putative TEGT family carrier/transport protein [uncultured Gammaproteobacteria bacterium]SHN89727.1 Putative TEGT family carrier/transport protein [bacterium endosymbiont of Bathymodiolus sp. 5 South]VVH59683.1 Putative TEGT family carrier/transport protein [uncultured Gammaproteobacteria bacterium]
MNTFANMATMRVAKVKNKVLSDTMKLLSYTLVFGGLSSWFSISIGAGFSSAIVSLIAAIAVIWFVLPRTQNSNMGILTAFSVAGLLGYSLGPMLTHYLAMPNGASLVMQALTGTGVSFFAISFYVQNTKKDFSFLNGMIFFAMVGIIVLSLVNIFFIESSFVGLAISFAVVLIMGAFMLSQMSAIINGGETNYISATVGLYLALHNMFTSLLHILGAFGDD